jgi:hypothetical protein
MRAAHRSSGTLPAWEIHASEASVRFPVPACPKGFRSLESRTRTLRVPRLALTVDAVHPSGRAPTGIAARFARIDPHGSDHPSACGCRQAAAVVSSSARGRTAEATQVPAPMTRAAVSHGARIAWDFWCRAAKVTPGTPGAALPSGQRGAATATRGARSAAPMAPPRSPRLATRTAGGSSSRKRWGPKAVRIRSA